MSEDDLDETNNNNDNEARNRILFSITNLPIKPKGG